MIRIEPREATSRTFSVGVPVLSALISLAFAAIPLLAAGANPITAYGEMFKGVFGSVFAVTEMLTRATPLIHPFVAAPVDQVGSWPNGVAQRDPPKEYRWPPPATTQRRDQDPRGLIRRMQVG